MALVLNFGKYKGMSVEEVALGRQPLGEENPKSEGYFYFFQLLGGDAKYFESFRTPENVARWAEIHHQLNNFKSIKPCITCGKDATLVSIVGDNSGYSFYPHVSCDKLECKEEMILPYRSKLSSAVKKETRDRLHIRQKEEDDSKYHLKEYLDDAVKNVHQVNFNFDKYFYPIGFDTILRFGWSKGGTKSDEFQVYRLMMYLSGWPKGKVLNRESATKFIDGLELRSGSSRLKKQNLKTSVSI